MAEPAPDPVDLNISRDILSFIIIKARAFDAKVATDEAEDGSNATDDQERAILEDTGDDLTETELEDAIDGLDEEALIDLIAIAWLGRGDFAPEEFPEARALARERHARDSSAYLMGMPLLGDYLEEGLNSLGYSVTDESLGHL